VTNWGCTGCSPTEGPAPAEGIAARAGCHPRLVADWLDGQAASGLIGYDPAAGTYHLSSEAAMALADDSSPVFTARAMNAVGAFYADIDKLTAAFRGNGALAWADHHPRLFDGTEWLFRTGYRAYLPEWIAALDGVQPKLTAGARVADARAAATAPRSSWQKASPAPGSGASTPTGPRSAPHASGPRRQG
jgi:hypothetical protein